MNDNKKGADDTSGEVTQFDPYHPEIEHVYVAPKAPKLRTSVIVDEITYQVVFENCRVILHGEVARAFDTESMSRPAIKQMVFKVDKVKAAELVYAHMKNQGSAVKGAADTAQLDRLRGEITDGSTKTLGEMAPNNAKGLAEFSRNLANGDLLVTEAINPAGAAVKTGEHGGKLELNVK